MCLTWLLRRQTFAEVFVQHILSITGSVICRRIFSFYLEFFFLLVLKPERETKKKKNTMNISVKGTSVATKKLNAEATLNPNAAEFVPFALRSQDAVTTAEISPKLAEKSVLDRSESSISNNSKSEEEAQQYWSHQLPDDITPDFEVMGLDNAINSSPFLNLSLNDVNKASRYTSPRNSGFMLKEHQAFSPHRVDCNNRAGKLGYPVSPDGECFRSSLSKPWEKKREGNPYNGNSSEPFMAEMANKQLLLENADLCSLEFLASQFPSFASESIAEAYLSNGGDLNMTINVLTQLELRVEGGSNKTLNPKATPYWSSATDTSLRLRSFSTIPSRSVATDFASAARKMTSQEPSIWKYDRNGLSDSRQVLGSEHSNGQSRSIYGDRLQGRGSPLTSPIRLGAGGSVDMYSEKREEARDHARMQNAYFEQARQAYLIGNKTLAKELSILGQMHNLQMKAAQEKGQESVYRQRNSDVQSYRKEQIIDLHGLNMSDSIFVLKRELGALRNAARSLDQRVLISIRVGPSPARLLVAVQRYLLEEEGLDCYEPRPGLLRVVI